MNWKRWIPAGLLAAIAALLLIPDAPEPPAVPAASTAEAPQRAPGEAFLPYRPAAPHTDEHPSEALAAIAIPAPSAHAIPDEYTLFFRDAESLHAFLESASRAGTTVLGSLPGLLAARVRASAADLAQLLQPGMEVDLNHRMEVPAPPSADFWQQGDLAAFNADMAAFLGIPATDERLSWGSGVTIAVLDTGWNGHPAVANGALRQIDLVEQAAEGEFSGHGTAVAGLIGSSDPFAPGIAPGSELLSVRVLDNAGRGDAFTLAQGILAAVDAGADIINMSLGGYGDSEVLRRAVAYAGGQGVLMVASTGNDGIGAPTYPAAYTPVVGVTAVDAAGNRTPYANYGNGVDVAAPGYQIHALWDADAYVYFNGTSAAAPLVAGMAARLIESGRASTPEALRQLLRDHANEAGPPGDDPLYGAGILNGARLENIGRRGVIDIAVADLYPAVEQRDGSTFPLHVSFENRGTDYIPEAAVELTINGFPAYYRLLGLNPGAVDSIQIPVPESALSGSGFTVDARVSLPAHYTDAQPGNDRGEIRLASDPVE